MVPKLEDQAIDIPERLYDSNTRTIYTRMRFFGKGAFAMCYEIVDEATNDVYAGKIMSKKLMLKYNQRGKIAQEINIHKGLCHPNVVHFHSFFEDTHNIYIVLELCKRRSMMELYDRRATITEYECRYYIQQIAQGVKYLHDNRIIHRDLKLGNLFLNDQLHVKIGDFGLATRIEYEGERKKTLCGTPNYIAPEILTKKGHSFEVDVWSIGCIMYTLLVGQAPFNTNTLKDTYMKIKKCEYMVPSNLSKPAADMVVAMLQPDPQKRPTAGDLLQFEFLKSSAVPHSLPSACLTMAPRVGAEDETTDPAERLAGCKQPLVQQNDPKVDARLELPRSIKDNVQDAIISAASAGRQRLDLRRDLECLRSQLGDLFAANPKVLPANLTAEHTDPAAQPLLWISKWVDYSNKYGFGYQLCDEGIGVMFNDTTKLLLHPNQIDVHFIDQCGKESYMTTTCYNRALEKKMKLLAFFKGYMSKLAKAGASNVESDQISRMPHLNSWFRTTSAVIMHLTNSAVQLNFSDHAKVVLCPRMSAITYMDNRRNFRTYRFSTIATHGCSKDLYQRMRYAHEKLTQNIENLC